MNLKEIIESLLKDKDQTTLTPQKIETFRHSLTHLKLDKKNPNRLIGLSRINKEIQLQQLAFTIESKTQRLYGERATVWIITRQQKNVGTKLKNVATIQKNMDMKQNFVAKESLAASELYEMIETEKPFENWLQETIVRFQYELNRYQNEQEMNQRIENEKLWKEMYEPETMQEEIEPENKCYDTNLLTDDVFESINMVKFIDNMLIESPKLKEHFYKLGSNYSMDQIGYDEFIKRWNEGTH